MTISEKRRGGTELELLVDKIQQEGVKVAEQKRIEIIQEAENRAKDIIAKAKFEASEITKKAKDDLKKYERMTRDNLKRGARDLILSLKSQLTSHFEQFLKDEIAKAYDQGLLDKCVTTLLEHWQQQAEQDPNLNIILTDYDKKKLENFVAINFRNYLKDGLQLLSQDKKAKGFFLQETGNDFFYDFTAGGLAKVLSDYLVEERDLLAQVELEES